MTNAKRSKNATPSVDYSARCGGDSRFAGHYCKRIYSFRTRTRTQAQPVLVLDWFAGESSTSTISLSTRRKRVAMPNAARRCRNFLTLPTPLTAFRTTSLWRTDCLSRANHFFPVAHWFLHFVGFNDHTGSVNCADLEGVFNRFQIVTGV